MRVRSAAVAVATVGLSLGCFSSVDDGDAHERLESRVRLVTAQFARYRATVGRLPRDADELKAAIGEMGPDVFNRFGLISVDDALVSERDGKPLVIYYTPKDRPAGVGPTVFVFEQVGVAGKRFVGHDIGAVEEVDETRFREMVPLAAWP